MDMGVCGNRVRSVHAFRLLSEAPYMKIMGRMGHIFYSCRYPFLPFNVFINDNCIHLTGIRILFIWSCVLDLP